MKTSFRYIFTVFFALASCASLKAQFKTAALQASGLTCAMCTKAINNALAELPFIQSVKADIGKSAFMITFKPDAKVNIDHLKKAVEDAGFSIAMLKLSGNFKNLAIKHDEHVQVNGSNFHFLNVKSQTLSGEKEITLVDKNFLLAKDFKKYSKSTQMQCFQTGKAAACCKKEGIVPNSRIYHVTI